MSTYPNSIQRLIKLADRFAERCDQIDRQSIINAMASSGQVPSGIEEMCLALLSALQGLSPGQLYLIAATLIVAQGNGDFTKVLSAYDTLRECLPEPISAAFYVVCHGSSLSMLLEFALTQFNALDIDVHDLFSPIPAGQDEQST
jgi:hypothetical protein